MRRNAAGPLSLNIPVAKTLIGNIIRVISLAAVLAIIKIWQLSMPTLEIYESYFIRFSLSGQQKSLGSLDLSFFGRTPLCVLRLFFSIYASSLIRHKCQ
jgi:hypothetical protein